jgi:hypothetical protein
MSFSLLSSPLRSDQVVRSRDVVELEKSWCLLLTNPPFISIAKPQAGRSRKGREGKELPCLETSPRRDACSRIWKK